MTNDSIRRLIAEVRTLPSLPAIYRELVDALESPQAAVDTAARIISKDMTMVSKILQVVNSSYFSFQPPADHFQPWSRHAIALLGIETIKSLALALHAFSESSQRTLPVSADTLWTHGRRWAPPLGPSPFRNGSATA
ncbi:MAG TPA: HDOD domain-containing protein [Nitrospira sp.]|nr:HDOD domain-containing protein [Nitrospira sp.]